jgi:putative membrane protein
LLLAEATLEEGLVVRITLIAAAAGLVLSSHALAQPSQALSTHDFVKVAAQTDAFERAEGRLAAERGSTHQVRDFGRMMVADHTKTTVALKAALRKAGLPAPPPPPLSGEEQGNIAMLRGLHGPAFDKAYLAEQISTHQTALQVMQGYASGGDNAVLRGAAGDTAPIVEHHLKMAQQIAGGM